MTEPTPEERAEAERILGKCSCLSDYALRNLTDPNCHWCEHWEDVMELIRERTKYRGERNELRACALSAINCLRVAAGMPPMRFGEKP